MNDYSNANGVYEMQNGILCEGKPTYKCVGCNYDRYLIFNSVNGPRWWIMRGAFPEDCGKTSGYGYVSYVSALLPHLVQGQWRVYDGAEWSDASSGFTCEGKTASAIRPAS